MTAAFAPKDDSILIIGTAGQGVVNTPYQVTDRAVAAKEFGFSGSLERAMEECASNSDNILAFRAGTQPMVLAGVGLSNGVGLVAPVTAAHARATELVVPVVVTFASGLPTVSPAAFRAVTL